MKDKLLDFKEWFIDGLRPGATSKGPKIILFVIAAIFIALAIKQVVWYYQGMAALNAAGK